MPVLACKHRYLQGKFFGSHITEPVVFNYLFLILNRNTTSSVTVTFLVHLSKLGVNSIAYLTALLDRRKNYKPEVALNDTS